VTDVFAAVDQMVVADGFAAAFVCDVLGVSRSGFYTWRSEAESRRSLRDRKLMPLVQEIFWQHRRRYGARRIAAELARRDNAVGVARVARLLRAQGLQAIQPKSFKPSTTQSRHRLGYNDNLLAGEPGPSGINEVWVGDITYIPLRSSRFGYLALLLDLFSRRIVGWEYGASLAEELVVGALQRAIGLRQPRAGLIHHSDRGGQYASKAYRAVLRRWEFRQSMSGAGNCYDNAFMESCFGTIKTELELVDYADGSEAIRELGQYVRYYNLERRHSALGYATPIEFETCLTPSHLS
jgi:putative transposase